MSWNLLTSFCAALMFVGITKLLFGVSLVNYCLFLAGVNIALVVSTELSRRRTNKNVKEVLEELKRDSDNNHIPFIANRPPMKEDLKFPHYYLWVERKNFKSPPEEHTYYVYYWHTVENKEWIKLKVNKE